MGATPKYSRYVRLTIQAVRLHGANGVSDRYPVEGSSATSAWPRSPMAREVHQLLIGRAAIGLDAFWELRVQRGDRAVLAPLNGAWVEIGG
jgi:hypothetical protein